MPADSDFALGKEAVKRKIITQKQLEECVELLFDLEKVGSKKGLADVVVDRGYATAEQLEELKDEMGGEEEKTLLETLEEEETKENLLSRASKPAGRKAAVSRMSVQPVPPNPSEYCFIHISGSGDASLLVLPRKPIAIGRESSNDIVVVEGPVSKRHARLTCAPDGMTLWDVGSRNGTFVNDERITSRKLSSGDVVSIGNSYLVFSHVDQPDGTIVGSITPDVPENEAVAVLSGHEGFDEGSNFYVGSRPFLIGSEPINNLPLEGEEIGPIHAQIALTPEGVRILDLNSKAGIQLNGRPDERALLDEGDVIQIGEYVLRVASVERKPTAEEVAPPRPAISSRRAASSPKASRQDRAPAGKPIDEEATLIASKEELKKAAEDEDVLLDLGAALRAEAGLSPLESEMPERITLICIAGPRKGTAYPVTDKPITIGRSTKATIFLEDLAVSREHAMIKKTGAKVEVIDLGSRNGVLVNGKRVMTKVLKPGDKVTIGKSTFLAKAEG